MAFSTLNFLTDQNFPVAKQTPLPARKDTPSDLDRLDRLAIQVNKEALIAKRCQENYFVSFDNYEAARAAGEVLTPEILPSLDVKFHSIKAPYNSY
ncbi:hypothetical protein [Myxosarcina sp. GI1]|uniref:hypothetical protein n=1 Tax=Myxosarcina sp. GI1 TaxID=1541065 RepID=UPI0012E0427D|nr:hypothetical protein [Myxosarcina sp. GI1]